MQSYICVKICAVNNMENVIVTTASENIFSFLCKLDISISQFMLCKKKLYG